LRSPLLVALGLGSRETLDDGVWSEVAQDAVRRAVSLGVRVAALGLFGDGFAENRFRRGVSALIAEAVREVSGRAEPLALQLVVDAARAGDAAALLPSCRPSELPPEIDLKLARHALPSSDQSLGPAGMTSSHSQATRPFK